MNSIYMFMLEHPILYTTLVVVLSGFIWLLIIDLCHTASDSETRLEKHIMELDEFEEESWK